MDDVNKRLSVEGMVCVIISYTHLVTLSYLDFKAFYYLNFLNRNIKTWQMNLFTKPNRLTDIEDKDDYQRGK